MVSDVVAKLFSLVDSIVELYLDSAVPPIVAIHRSCQAHLNQLVEKLFREHKSHIPTWLRTGFLSYVRVVLVLPIVLLLSWGQALFPSLLVTIVSLSDLIKDHIAIHWEQEGKTEQQKSEATATPRPVSPSYEDSFGKKENCVR